MEVHGIKNGTLGLIKRPLEVEKLTYKSFKGFLINQNPKDRGLTIFECGKLSLMEIIE